MYSMGRSMGSKLVSLVWYHTWSERHQILTLRERKVDIEKLWGEFLSDPSQWWDHRCEKINPRFPDFTHKRTQMALWRSSELNPAWVEAGLAAIPPGSLQVNVFSWNQKISRYSKCGQHGKAIELFQQMQQEGITPDKFTFFRVLKACARTGALEEGRRAHDQIIRSPYASDIFVGSCLVDMYANCGSIDDARRVFNKMPTRDVVVWNTMVLGYVKCGDGQKALELYRRMQSEGLDPSPATFVAILTACASVAALEEGRHAHKQIIERGYESDVIVSNCLVDMYAKCGSMDDAERVFNKMPTQNVVAWTAITLGYVKYGQGQKALELSQLMQSKGVDPDPITIVAILNACASVAALAEGRNVHKQIIQRGYDSDVFVSNSLVDMYAKCGSIDDAWRVFNKMPTRDVVAWNAMILGCVKCGQGQKGLKLSQQMQREGLDPNRATFIAILNACASMAALEDGKHVHEQIIHRGYESDVVISNCLVDMYAKCGSIEDAERVFTKMPTRDLVSWTTMLEGYGRQGYAEDAIELFERMRSIVDVDGVTFISLLSACSHRGLVDEGLDYFESMSAVHNISPTVEHYVSVVDLLGRAGHLHEAEDLTRNMPVEPDAALWMSLLGACKVHGNVEMGECHVNQVLQLEPENAGVYLLLSNMYATAGKLDCRASVPRR